MRHIARHTIALLFCAAVVLPASAQEFRSSYFMQTSNFRHQMNPALLDESYISFPLLGNINVGTTGNIGLSNFVYKLSGNPKYDLTTFMSPTVDAGKFLGDLSDNNRADVYLNMNIFSVGFKGFKGQNVVELNLRSNTNLSMPKELFTFMKTAGAKERYEIRDLGLRHQTYAELALGHSHAINEQWKVGGKLKFLLGGAFADLAVNKLDLTMNGDYWNVQADAQLKGALLDTEFEYASDSKRAADGRRRVDGIEDPEFNGLPGFGLAVDLGATYKPIKNLTISLGVTDLGFINWSNTLHASSAGDYTFNGFEKIRVEGSENGRKLGDQFEDLGRDLEDMFNLYDDGKKSASQVLAATVNVGAEYALPAYDKLRFGALYTARINGIYTYHQGMLAATIRPVKAIEATVNAAAGSTGVTAGAAISFRAPHFDFYVGTDRFIGKVGKQYIPLNNLNANVVLGMTFPL